MLRIQPRFPLLIAVALLLPLLLWLPRVHAAETANSGESKQFLKLFPGVFSERESALAGAFLAESAAIKARGPVDVKALIENRLPNGTPGIGPVIPVSEEWVRYNNGKYDPENPLRHDRDYAIKAGFADILAIPVFGAHDDTFMVHYPSDARDTLQVSELNHTVTMLAPIYPGDTLFLVVDDRELLDLTPVEGSIYRSLAINYWGSIYNQRGVKVNEVVFRVMESVKIYADPAARPAKPDFARVWEAPDWLSRRPHFYTDEDWRWIKSVWAAEKRRGSEPLYWEDVKIGDRPVPTLDGPVEVSVSPVPPWGMGSGGSKTLKAQIMDAQSARKLIRGQKDGIYRMAHRSEQIPVAPSQELPPGAPAPEAGAIDSRDIHKEGVQRSALVNYMGREFAIRHLGNWMSDRGTLRKISWSIMDPRAFALHGKSAVHNPRADHWLDEVPALRGSHVNTHGLTQDIAYVQSSVVSKYVLDGHFMVDLVWWIQTIDGHIWEEGKASIELPQNPPH
jgi:hypothetical protein